jgi:flavin reductase (DIM6/NTAB) family NADH-FMN oxidoreductase RutF
VENVLEIDAAALGADDAYKLLVGAVVPRPIAWVTTRSQSGRVNLAPFSCFTFVSSDPPMLAISVGRLRGALKDTARNIAREGSFVVHIADESQVELVHRSSEEFPEEISEVEELRLQLAASRRVATPRLASAPVAMECRHAQTVEFGRLRAQLIVGEVLTFHVSPSLYRDGKIDAARFRPIARLGGPRYARLGEIVTLQPVYVTPKKAAQ